MSKIEVNQISSQCGSTLTIGQSGDTVTLACGATQTGFGRTGTVDWCTTAKTAPFTGVSGKGYFVNTTCGAVTVTLPATPTAGDIISIKDYARTAATNNINFCRNGSKMDGACASSGISTNGDSTTLIYVDGTQGWTSILDNTTNQYGATYVTATGGTVLTCGDFKTHIFTADGCFAVSNAGNPIGSNTVSYIVVAGGGGGGNNHGGGGGAGGYRESKAANDTYTASPLNATSGPTYNLPVSVQTYPITVGAGGAQMQSGGCGSNGGNSIFSSITSAGGGVGGRPSVAASPGGSGAGANGEGAPNAVGSGNTPPVSPSQGNNGGGSSAPSGGGSGGGGGGAGAVGATGPGGPSNPGVAGGDGVNIGTNFFGPTSGSYGTPGPAPGRYFAGGGGGNGGPTGIPSGGAGGAGGGGTGGAGSNAGTAGTTNTGGGGGGEPGNGQIGLNGGSGIVMIRYKFQ
jgi:hypothetical protein